jgi:hypothetical protein
MGLLEAGVDNVPQGIRYRDSTVYRYDRCSTCRRGFGVRDSNGHERRAHGGLARDSHMSLLEKDSL